MFPAHSYTVPNRNYIQICAIVLKQICIQLLQRLRLPIYLTFVRNLSIPQYTIDMDKPRVHNLQSPFIVLFGGNPVSIDWRGMEGNSRTDLILSLYSTLRLFEFLYPGLGRGGILHNHIALLFKHVHLLRLSHLPWQPPCPLLQGGAGRPLRMLSHHLSSLQTLFRVRQGVALSLLSAENQA